MTATTKHTETVTFELPDYKNETNGVVDGNHVRVEYDSNFGGTQTAEGNSEIVRELENGKFRRHLVVGNRKVSSGRVFSTAGGRKVGTVESITVTMDADSAIEWVAKEWNGHDVDTHDDEIYVQFWSGQLHDEMSNEEFLNHTDAIRFKKNE